MDNRSMMPPMCVTELTDRYAKHVGKTIVDVIPTYRVYEDGSVGEVTVQFEFDDGTYTMVYGATRDHIDEI